jgi:hypothetical protein
VIASVPHSIIDAAAQSDLHMQEAILPLIVYFGIFTKKLIFDSLLGAKDTDI